MYNNVLVILILGLTLVCQCGYSAVNNVKNEATKQYQKADQILNKALMLQSKERNEQIKKGFGLLKSIKNNFPNEKEIITDCYVIEAFVLRVLGRSDEVIPILEKGLEAINDEGKWNKQKFTLLYLIASQQKDDLIALSTIKRINFEIDSFDMARVQGLKAYCLSNIAYDYLQKSYRVYREILAKNDLFFGDRLHFTEQYMKLLVRNGEISAAQEIVLGFRKYVSGENKKYIYKSVKLEARLIKECLLKGFGKSAQDIYDSIVTSGFYGQKQLSSIKNIMKK